MQIRRTVNQHFQAVVHHQQGMKLMFQLVCSIPMIPSWPCLCSEIRSYPAGERPGKVGSGTLPCKPCKTLATHATIPFGSNTNATGLVAKEHSTASHDWLPSLELIHCIGLSAEFPRVMLWVPNSQHIAYAHGSTVVLHNGGCA